MKKILLAILGILCIGGCQKNTNNDILSDVSKMITKSKSYHLKGHMELLNDEETFNYTVDVAYLQDNYYKVELINTANEHKQIILRNDEGLYVITPSLNKSFKFESSWPDNSSQAYILSSLLKDMENDEKTESMQDGNGYIIKTKVNYPNNSDLKYEKIYLDKDKKIKKVEVYGEADIPKIKVEFNEMNLKANYNKKEFDLKNYVSEIKCEGEGCDSEETMSKIESAIYPLYMPSNTYLSSSEVVSDDIDSRIILTFAGDKNFVIVEETAAPSTEHEIIPVYGEPLMLNDTIAALSSNSMYWTSNDIDYYIVSEDLTISEMVFIASSLGNSQATMGSK